jgi:hypothetical protein
MIICQSIQEQTVIRRLKIFKPAERPIVESSRLTRLVIATAVGRSAGSIVFGDFDPGVSLRFTPGFMLAAASRAHR